MSINHIPNGFTSITPYFICTDAAAFIAFIKAAFDAEQFEMTVEEGHIRHFGFKVFGSVIEDLKGMYRVLPIYILGGIVGALAYLFIGQIIPAVVGVNSVYYLGVMPSVFAVVTASLCFKPTYTYSFYSVRIPLWVLAIAFYILKIGTLSAYSLQIMALIFGGIATGLLYNYGGLLIFDKITSLFKSIAQKGSNENFVEKKSSSIHSSSSSTRASTIDEILDKINQHGMRSLSPTEKNILESYSQEK